MLEFLVGGVCAGGSFILLVVLAALFFELPLWVFFMPYILCFGRPCAGALMNLPEILDPNNKKSKNDFGIILLFVITLALCVAAFLLRNYNCKDVLFWLITLIQDIF